MANTTGCMGLLFKTFLILLLLLTWVWGGFAIFFSWPDPELSKMVLLTIFGFFLPVSFIFTRSFLKGLLLCLGALAVLIIWWQTLQPTGQKDWAADVAQISHGKIDGNKLTMYNVRDFRYKGDEITEERWETREYNLDKIQGIDLFLSYWASEHIAHTIMSWDFGDNTHLAISIETRKDKKQEYSAVKGFFKQFELSYIAADERDIIRLRTNYRKERVYVYRLIAQKERIRALLENYLTEMNRLVDQPEFYDALTKNCTTTIHLHTNAIQPDNPAPMDWRLLASGHIDELLYDKGGIDATLPFAQLRQKSRIDLRMQGLGEEDFSRLLRADPTKGDSAN